MPSSSAVAALFVALFIAISLTRAGDLDVQTQGLHLLDEHLEGLGDDGLGMFSPLTIALVDLDAAGVSSDLMVSISCRRVGGAVGLERPDLHLAEALAAELGLAAERLLGDHRVRAGRTGVDLVVDQVGELQDVHVADRR